MMNTKLGVPAIRAFLQKIDWQLLLFLLLFLQVKLALKVTGVALIYLLQWNLRFGFRLRNSRLPLFYPAVIIIALFGLVLNHTFLNAHYDIAFITGIGFWVLCILSIHQVKLFVDRNEDEKINQTIIVFFALNALVSILSLLIIIVKTGAVNPYLYQGEYQKYFISTGDYVKGITFDTSTTNAVLNALGIIYFLKKRNVPMVFLCMAILILTASNFTSLLLLIVFAGLFFFQSDADQKSVMMVCFFMLVIFLGKISPQNDDYVSQVFEKFFPKGNPANQKNAPAQTPTLATASKVIPVSQRPDTTKRDLIAKAVRSIPVKDKPLMDWIRADIRPAIPEPNINTPPYQQRNDTTDFQKRLFQFIYDNGIQLPLCINSSKVPLLPPGKLIALRQTLDFMREHPGKIFFGDGIGNFSSKLAFRISGLNIEGGYPENLSYMSREFKSNHFDLYLYFFSKQKELHSVINTSDSVYDQLFAEYGVFGLAAFAIFYVGFFLKRVVKNTYAFPLVVLALGVFAVGYWFEQLSVVVFFEMLMFLNIKEKKNNTAFNVQ